MPLFSSTVQVREPNTRDIFSSRAGKHDCASQVISLTEHCSVQWVLPLRLSYDYRFDPQKNVVSVGLKSPVSVVLKSA